MKAFDTAELKGFMLSHLDKKAFRQGAEALDALMDDLIRYDIHFMRLTGVLDKDDDWGDSEYDEDDALEYIYDAYLGDHPSEEDEGMQIAALLNRYMELKDDYFDQ